MDQRITVVTLGVADLDRSRRFYCNGLGFQTSSKPHGSSAAEGQLILPN